MAADNVDFEEAQKIHDLLIQVATQGSKDDALQCEAMGRLGSMLGAQDLYDATDLHEFLFRCAIALQFGPVQDIDGDGARAGDAATWGDDSLTQEDRDRIKHIEQLAEGYKARHSEGDLELAPQEPDDPNLI